ncbi:MAG: putative iron-dependent peroxidase [Francisellaceae bacterium]|jgi:putative iron-dependent peroxidase
MLPIQGGILAGVPSQSRYLNFKLYEQKNLQECLWSLKKIIDGSSAVLGLAGTIVGLYAEIEGLKSAEEINANGVYVPASDFDLWVWLREEDRGKIFHLSHTIVNALSPAFTLSLVDDGFKYLDGNDLSGFKDGTENPTGDDAVEAAFIQDKIKGLYGSTFLATQKWKSNFAWLSGQSQQHKERLIGRSLIDDHEFENNHASAHVSRTAQESFDPEAFILRRSMPWVKGLDGGLMFVSFSKTLTAFEVQLNRMCGLDDGIVDGLFEFTKPVTNAYFWCPPFRTGALDLSLLGI